MNVVELSDKDTVAIQSETFVESLADIRITLDRKRELKRLHGPIDSSAPQHNIDESIEDLDEL